MSFFKIHFHQTHIPPLLPLMTCFIIGIACQTYLPFFFILFSISLLYIFFTQQTHLIYRTLYLFFATMGAWSHQQEWQNYNQFYDFATNKKITITGTIIDSNETITNHKKSIALTLFIDKIATNDTTYSSNKTIVIYTKSNKSLIVGDSVTFSDLYLKKPSNEDFQKYQIKEQVLATLFDDNVHFKVDNHPEWSFRNWIWTHKKRLLHTLESKLSPECFRFFSSLFLGNRTCIKKDLEETNEQFKTWGISHFLARSGLHLVLFIFIWQSIFCIIPLPLFIKQSIILLISCIYFTLTWTSAPFTRSFALFVFNKICLFSRIPFHLLHYLTLVCFIFLLYCPLYLFFLDFQLSFALTFALAWLNQVTAKHAV